MNNSISFLITLIHFNLPRTLRLILSLIPYVHSVPTLTAMNLKLIINNMIYVRFESVICVVIFLCFVLARTFPPSTLVATRDRRFLVSS